MKFNLICEIEKLQKEILGSAGNRVTNLNHQNNFYAIKNENNLVL